MRAPPAPENNAAAGPARGPCQACTRTLAYHGQLAVPPSTRYRGTTSNISVQHMRHSSTPPERYGCSAPAKPDTAKTYTAKPAQLDEEGRRYPSECTGSRRAANEPQRRLSVNVPSHAKVEVANENDMWYLYTPHPHTNPPAQPSKHRARRTYREHSNSQDPTTGTNRNNITTLPRLNHALDTITRRPARQLALNAMLHVGTRICM
jgi:hypothetical protein